MFGLAKSLVVSGMRLGVQLWVADKVKHAIDGAISFVRK